MKQFAAFVCLATLTAAQADDEYREFKGHEGPTRVVRFTPDGTKLISCSGWPEGDKTIRIWDVKTGKVIHTLKGHTDNIDGMCVSANGKTILSGGSDGTARLWDVTTGKELKKFDGHKKAGVPGVVIAPDGKTAVTGDTSGTIIAWKTDTLQEVFKVKGHTDHVRGLAFTPDGKTLVSVSWDRSMKTWNPADGKEKKTIAVGAGKIEGLAITPDGKEVVLACPRLSRWDLEMGQELKRYTTGGLSVDISTDGKWLLVGRYGGEMNLRNLATGQEKAKFIAHQGNVYGVAFAPDGKTAASGGAGPTVDGKTTKGEDFAVRVWNLDD